MSFAQSLNNARANASTAVAIILFRIIKSDESDVEDRIGRANLIDKGARDGIVNSENHKISTAEISFTDLHRGNVNTELGKHSTDFTDNAGSVDMRAN